MENQKSFVSNPRDSSRRRFFASAGGVVGAVAFANLLPNMARAADLPALSASDPAAAALNYTDDASKVDAAKSPTHVAGNACANCNQFQGAGAATGPCQLFPGKSVNAKGWCSGYVKKA